MRLSAGQRLVTLIPAQGFTAAGSMPVLGADDRTLSTPRAANVGLLRRAMLVG
jgi:hypothetical protein